MGPPMVRHSMIDMMSASVAATARPNAAALRACSVSAVAAATSRLDRSRRTPSADVSSRSVAPIAGIRCCVDTESAILACPAAAAAYSLGTNDATCATAVPIFVDAACMPMCASESDVAERTVSCESIDARICGWCRNTSERSRRRSSSVPARMRLSNSDAANSRFCSTVVNECSFSSDCSARSNGTSSTSAMPTRPTPNLERMLTGATGRSGELGEDPAPPDRMGTLLRAGCHHRRSSAAVHGDVAA